MVRVFLRRHNLNIAAAQVRDYWAAVLALNFFRPGASNVSGRDVLTIRAARGAAIGVLLALSAASSQAAEAVIYRGKGTYEVTRTPMRLHSGGAVVIISAQTIATFEPSESGFASGECSGVGYLSPAGDYSTDVYCTFSVRGGDGFDFRARTGSYGGSLEVLGGTGDWEGATGSGAFIHRFSEGTTVSFEYEIAIDVP